VSLFACWKMKQFNRNVCRHYDRFDDSRFGSTDHRQCGGHRWRRRVDDLRCGSGLRRFDSPLEFADAFNTTLFVAADLTGTTQGVRQLGKQVIKKAKSFAGTAVTNVASGLGGEILPATRIRAIAKGEELVI